MCVWKVNQAPLKEQQVLLSTQPLFSILGVVEAGSMSPISAVD